VRTLFCALILSTLVAPAWVRVASGAKKAVDPRRTPAVEIFERYKDAIVYLAGPTVSEKGQATEEFFELSKKHEINKLGTGFVIHESGLIISNAHVVNKVIVHYVTLSGGKKGKKYAAELLGVVRQHDLALLKIDVGRPLPAVQLGQSDDLLIGEPLIVIGNPHGLVRTCTVGVVSALGRSTRPSGLPGITLPGQIQTDASTSGGSSGGPWFNILGEVIGVTTCRRTDAENIAFGTPVAAVRRHLPEMLDVERRQGIATGLEFQLKMPCKVTAVIANSPAAGADVQPNDVLVKIDGNLIADQSDFCLALLGRKTGETLKLELIRGEKLIETPLVLATRPKLDGAAILKTKYGLSAVPLDEEKAETTSLRVRRGVVITEVAKGAPWDYDKLKSPPLAGDVLARINSIRPRDLDHVGLLLDRIPPGQKVNMVLLRRKEKTVTRVDLTVTTPK